MDKNVIKKHIRGFEILFIFVLFLAVSSLYGLGFFERFELILIDSRYRIFPAPKDPSIAIVAIDKSSLKELPQWPWPRTFHGGVVNQLRESGARVIGFDMDFSAHRIFEEDMAFSREIQKAGNVVLGGFSEIRLVADLKIQSSSFPIETLSKVSTGVGTLSFPSDLDGGVRRGFLDSELNGEHFLGFGAEIYRAYKGLSRNDIKWLTPRTLQMGNLELPSDSHHIFYVHYAGPAETFPTYSYSDVLKKRIDPAVFRDKIILVGASSVELQDLWNTPFQGLMPGVEIQANVVNSLLTGSSLYRIPSFGSILILLGFTLIWVSFSSFYVWKYGRWKSPIFSCFAPVFILFSLSMVVSLRLFSHHQLILDTSPIISQLFGMFMVSAIMLMIKSAQEVDEKGLSLTTLQSVGSLSHENRSLEDSINFILSMLQETMKVDYSVAEILGEKENRSVITKGKPPGNVDGPLIVKVG
jgi:CHASE2 domain-containing sensor protein